MIHFVTLTVDFTDQGHVKECLFLLLANVYFKVTSKPARASVILRFYISDIKIIC